MQRIAAPAPCPSRVLLAAGPDERAFALISGPGDPDLSEWSVAGLEPVGEAESFDEAAALARVHGWFAVGYESYERGWRYAPRPRGEILSATRSTAGEILSATRSTAGEILSATRSTAGEILSATTVPNTRELAPDHGAQLGRVLLYAAVYARSVRTGEGRLLACAGATGAEHAARLAQLIFTEASRSPPWSPGRNSLRNALVPAVAKAEHQARIRAALELIAAGEIYQVNLTYPLTGEYEGDPRAAFFRLLDANPPPFSAFLSLSRDEAIISASPECFFTFDARARRLATYPIKGTRRRAADPATDRALAEELSCDPKERAEHLMIADLLRNDLGRVARPGAVAVEGLAYVESFAGVHHLTSRIVARVGPEVGAGEIMRALFPGGSITGAPKLRAMEVIAALETEPRGVYTGAIGLLLPDGSARASIAIRTAHLKRNEVRFGVGGGIVADSDPEREYEETILKSQALARALTNP